MRQGIGWLVVLACGIAHAAVTSDPERRMAYSPEDPEMQATSENIFSAFLALSLRKTNESPDLAKDEWMPVHELAAALPESERTGLRIEDAWGRPLFVRLTEDRVDLLSMGANGVSEFLDSGEADFGDDILLLEGKFVNSPGPWNRDDSRISAEAKRTMRDLRSLGTAVEEFWVDNHRFPRRDKEFVAVADLAPEISPIYIRGAPLVDGWGREMIFWSDTETYYLISAGADGVFEPEWLSVNDAQDPEGGAVDDPSRDIVFKNGRFVQRPVGTQQ